MSARAIDLSAAKVIESYVSASAITDIYYLAYKTIRDKIKFFLYWKTGDIAVVEPQDKQ